MKNQFENWSWTNCTIPSTPVIGNTTENSTTSPIPSLPVPQNGCATLYGEQVIATFGLTDLGSVSFNAGILAAIWIGLWIVAYILFLRLAFTLRSRVQVVKRKEFNLKTPDHKPAFPPPEVPAENGSTAKPSVDEIRYDNMRFSKMPEKYVLPDSFTVEDDGDKDTEALMQVHHQKVRQERISSIERKEDLDHSRLPKAIEEESYMTHHNGSSSRKKRISRGGGSKTKLSSRERLETVTGVAKDGFPVPSIRPQPSARLQHRYSSYEPTRPKLANDRRQQRQSMQPIRRRGHRLESDTEAFSIEEEPANS